MTPKRPSNLDEPVAASFSEEEEASSEEEEEEDPSEDEEEQAEKAPPKMASTFPSLMKNPSSKTQPAESSSDESSSDSEPEKAPAVKPIASIPMQHSAASAAAKKSRTKPPAVPAKRPGDGEASASASAAKSSKRAKKNADAADAVKDPAKSPGGGAAEKKLFQRLWSEDDEITILRGMIDYLKKGSDPNTDMAGFQEFIRKSITVQDFTKSQLQDKVRRLKKKYANNVKKKKYEPTNPLEKTAFELSKKIWGNRPVPGPKPNGTPSSSTAATAPSSSARNNAKAATPAAAKAKLASPAVVPEVDVKAEDSGILAGVLGLERSPLPEAVVQRGLDLIPADKKAKLEADWRKIHLVEFELFAKKTQLMSDQSRLIFEALRSDS